MSTRSDVGRGHPDYYQDAAEAIARRTPGAFFINQFANPANPQAHETTTGPEIFRQMQGWGYRSSSRRRYRGCS